MEENMKKNIGTWDRVIRAVVALVIAILIATKTLTGTLSVVLAVLAVIFLVTAAIGFCPLYFLFGVSTCKKKESN
jgi:hypothetical protein